MNTIGIDFHTILTQDVLFHILTKLPTKSLVQLRCVSKFFNYTISHPYFLNLHLASPALTVQPYTHHLVYYESTDYTKVYFSFIDSHDFSVCKEFESPFKSFNGYLRLVGSVRGIVCLFDTNYFNYVGTLILWNPFMGKFKLLPSLKEFSSSGERVSHIAVGFGFDHMSVDFKVVKILYNWCSEGAFRPEAFVYGLKIGSWRNIHSEVPCFMPIDWFRNVFANGFVHWLAYKRHLFNTQPDCIMSFDLVHEVFKAMELPKNLGSNVNELKLCASLDEKSIALFVSDFRGLSCNWSVWLMNDYGKVESWTRKYNVVLNRMFLPLRIVSDGQILAAIHDGRLVLTNVVMEGYKDLAVCGLPETFHMTGYNPSLALLDNGQKINELNSAYWERDNTKI